MSSLVAIVVLLALHEACGQSNVTGECQIALDRFTNSTEDCNRTYADLSLRDPTCEFSNDTLCQGSCAQLVKEIGCYCGTNNSIFSDIESTCHCGSIITCPMRVTVQADNCTKAVNSFNEDLRCKNASSDLSCPTLCHGSCRKLLKTISCECLAMTQLNHTGGEIIEHVNSSCNNCLNFVSPCSGSAMPSSSLLAVLVVVLVGVVFNTS
ncbi:uncharacterized protein [Dysidea avara]|uniref:uncharacterized protein isoform X1 n=1 Tax=Dysidea avara TaxID=196820 RepID=UPI00331AF61D